MKATSFAESIESMVSWSNVSLQASLTHFVQLCPVPSGIKPIHHSVPALRELLCRDLTECLPRLGLPRFDLPEVSEVVHEVHEIVLKPVDHILSEELVDICPNINEHIVKRREIVTDTLEGVRDVVPNVPATQELFLLQSPSSV